MRWSVARFWNQCTDDLANVAKSLESNKDVFWGKIMAKKASDS